MSDRTTPTSPTSEPSTDDTGRWVVLLVDYADPSKRTWSDFDAAEQAEVMCQHDAFEQAIAQHAQCRLVGGEALSGPNDAAVCRRVNGRTVVTEGCFSESIEQIGGLYIIDAPSRKVLVELLELLPTYVMEFRPTATV